MKMRPYFAALLIAVVPSFAADDDKKPAAPAAADASDEDLLPEDVRGFYGSVTATVESVDTTEITMKIKVITATPDASKNKAPNPESLAGMSITVTPLPKEKDGKSILDEKGSGYIKGAKSGDPVTLSIRAATKGDVFRLLKVPSAGSK